MEKELEVGEMIAVFPRFGNVPSLHKIERVTATMYVCEKIKFRKNLSIVSPNSFGPFRGRLANDEDYLMIRIAKAKNLLEKFKVSPENIDKVESLLGI